MLNQTIPSKQHMVLVTVGLYQGHCLTDKLNNSKNCSVLHILIRNAF